MLWHYQVNASPISRRGGEGHLIPNINLTAPSLLPCNLHEAKLIKEFLIAHAIKPPGIMLRVNPAGNH